MPTAPSEPPRASQRRAVGWWLIAVAVLVAAMVTLGGLTRLTGAGLSITEWQPVVGIVPPLSDQGWQGKFAKYRQIPQYRLENRAMRLAEFKAIYWWEWTHRFLGRLVGTAFLLPFVFFAATGAIPRRDWPRMVLLFALGGLQGLVGWWMVQSGLEIRVSVSQYRLAIHLGVAILLFGALLWIALEYLRPPPALRATSSASRGGKGMRWFGLALLGLVYLQMLLGALVAGLRAGLVYNTWPSMDGRVVPDDAFVSRPWWINFFENAGLAQFDHRVGAYVIAIGAVAWWFTVRRECSSDAVRASSTAIVFLVAVQILLGIVTLINQAPLLLAALHQATAVALFSATLWHAFELSSDGNHASASSGFALNPL